MSISANFRMNSCFKIAILVLALMAGNGAAEARSRATIKRITSVTTTPARVLGSVYCVQGRVAVKGWERDLVKRNPGLDKFHWSPITAARPGTIIFRQPGTSQMHYHYTRPAVMSLSEVQQIRQQEQAKSQSGSRRIAQADLAGHLTANNEQVRGQVVSTYGNNSSYAQAPGVYTYGNSYQSKVKGRLISTR